jgi:hypothetical protein
MSWIEVVDRAGRVVARRTALGVPCTVGSALDNALVVEDPEVAPYHARIDREEDGRLTVTVLGGSSGLSRPGAPERAMTLALTRSAAVAMGDSVIRLVDEATREAPIAGASPEPEASGWRAFVARRPVQWAAVAALTVVGAGIGFFTLPGSERGVNALVVAVVLLLSECIWVGMWALAGRIRHGQARFGQHFVVATVVAVLGWAVGEMESWQSFLLPGANAVALLLTALTALIWVFALLGHLRVMNRANWHKHVRIAASFGVGVFILVLAARQYQGQWSSDVEFSSVLKAWPARLVPAKTPEQLTASLKALQDQLDKDGEAVGSAAGDGGADSTSD